MKTLRLQIPAVALFLVLGAINPVLASSQAPACRTLFQPTTESQPSSLEAFNGLKTPPLPGQAEALAKLHVRETGRKDLPLELVSGDKVLFKLKRLLGEGKRGKVYLTEDGRAVKVLKDLEMPREFFQHANARSLWEAKEFDLPKIEYIDPLGTYMVQEYIRGETLMDVFSESQEIPRAVVEAVLAARKRGLELAKEKGMFFDLKAANFMLTPEGRVVFVDYGPRFDKNKAIYTFLPNGTDLPEDLFLEYFFYREARNKNMRVLMGNEEQQIQELLAASKYQYESIGAGRLRVLNTKGSKNLPEDVFLSEAFTLTQEEASASRAFQIALEMWNRGDLENIARQIPEWLNGQLPSKEAQHDFKEAREPLKQIRFLMVTLSAEDAIPTNFKRLVVRLGHVRDKWKRNDPTVTDTLLDLSLMLTKENLDLIEDELHSFRPASEQQFDARLAKIYAEIGEGAKMSRMTPKKLHDLRKTIGALQTMSEVAVALQPKSLRKFNLLMFLRVLNSEMGDFHDQFVIDGTQGTDRYKTEEVEIPEKISLCFFHSRGPKSCSNK